MHSRKFSIKHIAAQAAVSNATVDRVINNRSGVGAYTARRVFNAINELEEQSKTTTLTVKKVYIDIILNTPSCYSNLIKKAVLSVLPSIKPNNISPRFHFFENETPNTIAQNIDRITRNGTHGLIIKTTDDYQIRAAIDNTCSENIPVMTFCADIRRSKRTKHIGIDNYSAGQSAAYLLGNCLKSECETILVSISNPNFLNEAEREMGFRQVIRKHYPKAQIHTVTGGLGLYNNTYEQTEKYLVNNGSAHSVYSVGGANHAILDAFEKYDQAINYFIGHDLDGINKKLLKERKIQVVLDHDLETDLEHAFRHTLRFHSQSNDDENAPQGRFNIITPYNI